VSWSIANINCHRKPICHVYSGALVSRNIYDKLYEQWNNIGHEHWRKFTDEMKVEVYFHDDFTSMLTPKKINGYIGYWFFQQRTDRSKGGEIELANGTDKKILNYCSNTILIIETDKTFNVLARKHQLPQRPFCEIYFDDITNKKIKKFFY